MTVQNKPLRVFSNDGKWIGSVPYRVNPKTGLVQIVNSQGIIVNSQLRADEWRMMDQAVQESAGIGLQIVTDLRAANLVRPVASIGTMTVQYTQMSEMPAAEVSMDGKSRADNSRVEYKISGSPLPITSQRFEIPTRQLEASRQGGTPIDTSTAAASSRSVAEKLEDLVVDGDSTMVFDGNTLYGITSEPNRKTDTAGNLGGGDWGTIDNPVKTVAGAITALTAPTNNYNGPFMVYAAPTQFNQASLTYYSDGSAQTPAQRIRGLDRVAGFKALPKLQDGEVIVVQMTSDVIVLWEHLGISVLEWMSPDGMTSMFKVVAVLAAQPKSEYNGRSGIMHVTGA